MGAWDPRRQAKWTYGPQQPPGPFNSKVAGQQFVVGQRLEMPAAIGAPSSLRNYIANSAAHVQARGISNDHRLLGQHAHPSCTELIP